MFSSFIWLGAGFIVGSTVWLIFAPRDKKGASIPALLAGTVILFVASIGQMVTTMVSY